jgi:WD40 repeat protein
MDVDIFIPRRRNNHHFDRSSGEYKCNSLSRLFDLDGPILNRSLKNTQHDDHSIKKRVKRAAPSPSPSFFKSKRPTVVLDAVDVQDNFYIHFLDWSCKGDLAVGLRDSIYIVKDKDRKSRLIYSLAGGLNDVTSIAWTPCGERLVFVSNDGFIRVWQNERIVIEIPCCERGGYYELASCLSYHVIVAANRFGTVDLLDMRDLKNVRIRTSWNVPFMCQPTPSHNVTGLVFNDIGTRLAVGYNMNACFIYDVRSVNFVTELTGHSSAVKAIVWGKDKDNHTLYTGAGTLDCCLRAFRDDGTLLGTLNTGCQVTKLLMNHEKNKLIVGHGYNRNSSSNSVDMYGFIGVYGIDGIYGTSMYGIYGGNRVKLGKFELQDYVKTPLNPNSRILDMALYDKTLVSLTSDELLCFWDVDNVDVDTNAEQNSSCSFLSCVSTIR